MSFGINGADPFKSYASNADAGGGLTGYKRIRKKQKHKDDEDNQIAESDDNNYEIDFDDQDEDDFMM